MKRQRGFTLVELLSLFFVLVYLGTTVAIVYAVVHFAAKFW